MIEDSIKLDLKPLPQKNHFAIRHINPIVESSCIQNETDNKLGNGEIFFSLNIDAGFTKLLAQNVDDELKKMYPVSQYNPNYAYHTSDGIKLPNPINSYFIYSDNKIKRNFWAATELTFRFTIPAENIKIIPGKETKNNEATDKGMSIKKIGSKKWAGDGEDIQFIIRPLETKNLYTIRHVNSLVKSYCIPDPDQKKQGNGKVQIFLNIQNGLVLLPENINNEKESEPIEGMNLFLIYNDNKIKYNKETNEAAVLTLKFLVPFENALYLSDFNNKPGIKIKKINKARLKNPDIDLPAQFSNFDSNSLDAKSSTNQGMGNALDDGGVKSTTNQGMSDEMEMFSKSVTNDHTNAIVIG